MILPSRSVRPRIDRRLGAGARDLARKAVVAGLVATVVVGPFATRGVAAYGVPPCNVPGQFTPHPTNWFSVRVPRFPAGEQGMIDFAVEPLVPDRLYVTNGVSVMRSSDYGCHWEPSYALPETGAGATASNSRITEIEVSAPGVVYLPIQQTEPIEQPHVVVSKDAGKTWTSADGAALTATTGRIRDFDASLGNGNAAVMLVDHELDQPGVSVTGSQIAFFTDTAGQAWEPRWRFDRGTSVNTTGVSIQIVTDEELQSVVMNPLRPNEVWFYGVPGVFRSEGGQLVPVGIGKVSALDVSLDGQAVVAYSEDGLTGRFSLDAGERFARYPTGFVVDSVDISQGVPPVTAITGSGNVFFQVPVPGQRKPVTYDVSPLDGRGITDINVGIVDTLAAPWLFGRTTDTIEIAFSPRGERVKAPKGDVLATVQEPPEIIGDNRLEPASRSLTLLEGRSETIPYSLDLPAGSTPLDVYFMIDISGSMGGTISGVRSAMQDIADRLRGMNIDAQFGVGSFRAFNDPPAYARNRDIGPADASLAAALNSLQAGGGGAETQMFALMQSVTGEGGSGVQKGLQMNFRPGSLRVAIEATDEPISQGGNHPTPDAVVKALRAHDVKMTGLAIQDPPLLGDHDYDTPQEPAATLQDVALGSKAVAPAGGVDCDGDGEPEIDEGGPIVCIIAPSEADNAVLMADAIVNVLNAIEDIQDLTVSVSPTVAPGETSEVVSAIEPSLFPQVDLKESSAHAFDVTVRCPRVSEKTEYPLNVDVARNNGVLARAALNLTCKPLPVKKKKEPAPAVFPFFPITAILPPVPRPPEPVAEPNPNPQPNPQSQAQAQGALVAQRQHQTQIALAHQRLQEQMARELASEDFSFVNSHRDRRIPPFGFIAAAAVMTAAAAYSLALQRAHALKRAYDRRTRWP